MNKKFWLFGEILIVLALAFSPAFGQTMYSITNLGTLGMTDARDLNNQGQVVGNNGQHALLFSGGTMTDLGTLGGTWSKASAINDSGQVVGTSEYSPGYHYPHAFRYSGGTMTDLGSLPGGNGTSGAFGINGGGQIVGVSSWKYGNVSFLYSGGTMSNFWPNTYGHYTVAINNSGQMVLNVTAPFFLACYLYSGGVPTEVGRPGGLTGSSEGTAINESQIVGWFSTNGGNRAFLYSGGQMITLGTLGGNTSRANDINNNGQIVGTSTTSNGVTHGFLYSGGNMTDLTSTPDLTATSLELGTVPDALKFTYAIQSVPSSTSSTWLPVAINDQGQILCSSGILLTPTAPPSTSAKLYWANGVGLSNKISDTPIFTNTIPAGFMGDSAPVQVPASSLQNPPANATHVLLVVDPDNTISESDESNNKLALSFTSMLLFREGEDSSFTLGSASIPGWDHVALYANGRAYESHPGYDNGLYWDPDQAKFVNITFRDGVQAQHTKGSFQYDAQIAPSTAANAEVMLDPAVALEMASFIETQMGTTYMNDSCNGDYGFSCLLDNFQPDQQKGRTGAGYTCVGLIERAAEEAGLNKGQGFIPNDQEAFDVGFRKIFFLLPGTLKYYATKEGESSDMKGLIDPVDFILTDPTGRRLGHTASLGTLNEIPGALYSGDGNLEQFIIPNPQPGKYHLQLVGLGRPVAAAVGGYFEGQMFDGFLGMGETNDILISVPPPPTNQPPLIRTQPANWTSIAGSRARFTVTASGTAPLSYRWRRNDLDLADGVNVSGASTSVLNLANVQSSDVAAYDVVITNLYGAVTSSVATLTVVIPPGPGPGPTVIDDFNDHVANPSFWAVSYLTSGGGGLFEANQRLEYRVATPDLAEEFDEAGRMLAESISVPFNNDWEVQADVTNIADPQEGQSASVGLTILHPNGEHGIFLEMYASRSDLNGRGFVSGIDADGEPVPGSTDGDTGDIGVTTGAVRLVFNSQTKVISGFYDSDGAANGYTWSLLASYGIAGSGGSHGNDNWQLNADSLLRIALGGYSEGMTIASGQAYLDNFVFSNTASVTPPVITQSPQSITAPAGSAVTFPMTASGTEPLTYQWRKGGAPLSNGGNISGADTPTLTLANVQAADAGNYDVVVGNAAGTAASGIATLQ